MADVMELDSYRFAKDKKKHGWGTAAHYAYEIHKLGFEFFRNVLADRLEYTLNAGARTPMSDAVEASILYHLNNKGLDKPGVARTAMENIGNTNAYHPVKEYLENLTWDGEDHISKLASYFTDGHEAVVYADGSKRSLFHVLLRRWLFGAVGKVYDSVMHQNPVFVIDGAQRLGKSSFCQWLCPDKKLFFEGAIKPDDKDYWEYLSSFWVWEVSEIGSTVRKSDLDALKDFITKKEAIWRPAYGRRGIQKPTLSSFIGTLNDAGGFLNDPTGHSRFRPVQVIKIDFAYSKDVVLDQVWAQAMAMFKIGETCKLGEEEAAAVTESQQAYEIEDMNMERILKHFEFTGNFDDWVSNEDINDAIGEMYPKAKAEALKKIGCVFKNHRVCGKMMRGWSGLVKGK